MLEPGFENRLRESSVQQLREEFWRWEREIRESREKPKADTAADRQYGKAREHLTRVATELMDRLDDEDLYMDDKPWHHYL